MKEIRDFFRVKDKYDIDHDKFKTSLRGPMWSLLSIITLLSSVLMFQQVNMQFAAIYGIWGFIGLRNFQRPFTTKKVIMYFPIAFPMYIYFKLFTRKIVIKSKQECREEKIDKLLKKRWSIKNLF